MKKYPKNQQQKEEVHSRTQQEETKVKKNVEERMTSKISWMGDGSSKKYKILSEMLQDFDRMDVEQLFRLVKERYSSSAPEVIENGNSWVPIPVTAPESGPSTALKMTVPSTTEEKICKKNGSIKACFGGNDATKKTQKALLKQQYENFNATSSESLDSIFNRLQKLACEMRARQFLSENCKKDSIDEVVLLDRKSNVEVQQSQHGYFAKNGRVPRSIRKQKIGTKGTHQKQ
ncbi:hypothetical protein Tco_0969379 [Tanacetum coccineum]